MVILPQKGELGLRLELRDTDSCGAWRGEVGGRCYCLREAVGRGTVCMRGADIS